MSLEKLVRPNIRQVTGYDVPSGNSDALKLNKNENPWQVLNAYRELVLNRYPEADPVELKQMIAVYYGVTPTKILLSRGSDEAIDLIMRVFCRPSIDGILICPPTFSVYEWYARINALKIQQVPLVVNEKYALNTEGIIQGIAPWVKVIFICTPNNPTGNLISVKSIMKLCECLPDRLVIVDEAYIEFSNSPSAISLLKKFQNVIILRTLSKAYGLAGIRCGITFASQEVISYLRKIAAPYLLNTFSIATAKQLFGGGSHVQLDKKIQLIIDERNSLFAKLKESKSILQVWPSEANFILFRHVSAKQFYNFCFSNNLLLRIISDNELRVTIGKPEENARFLFLLYDFEALFL